MGVMEPPLTPPREDAALATAPWSRPASPTAGSQSDGFEMVDAGARAESSSDGDGTASPPEFQMPLPEMAAAADRVAIIAPSVELAFKIQLKLETSLQGQQFVYEAASYEDDFEATRYRLVVLATASSSVPARLAHFMHRHRAARLPVLPMPTSVYAPLLQSWVRGLLVCMADMQQLPSRLLYSPHWPADALLAKSDDSLAHLVAQTLERAPYRLDTITTDHMLDGFSNCAAPSRRHISIGLLVAYVAWSSVYIATTWLASGPPAPPAIDTAVLAALTTEKGLLASSTPLVVLNMVTDNVAVVDYTRPMLSEECALDAHVWRGRQELEEGERSAEEEEVSVFVNRLPFHGWTLQWDSAECWGNVMIEMCVDCGSDVPQACEVHGVAYDAAHPSLAYSVGRMRKWTRHAANAASERWSKVCEAVVTSPALNSELALRIRSYVALHAPVVWQRVSEGSNAAMRLCAHYGGTVRRMGVRSAALWGRRASLWFARVYGEGSEMAIALRERYMAELKRDVAYVRGNMLHAWEELRKSDVAVWRKEASRNLALASAWMRGAPIHARTVLNEWYCGIRGKHVSALSWH